MIYLLKTCAVYLTLTVSVLAYANSNETIVRCEQLDDADIWIEVGVTLNDGPGFQILVVEHDTDSGAQTLIRSEVVGLHKAGDVQTYSDEDNFDTIKLTSGDNFKTGHFAMLADGPSGINLSGMNCYTDKSPIDFD